MMNSKIKKSKLLFYLSIFAFFISSACVLSIPMVNFTDNGTPVILTYLVGGIFWLGLIAGIAISYFLTASKKRYDRQNSIRRGKKSLLFISFFSNLPALFIDIIFIISIIGVILITVFEGINAWFGASSIFLFLFSLEMHVLINGDNFKYITNKNFGGNANEQF